MKLSLGLIPSPPDERDYLLSSFLPPLKVSLPDEWTYWLQYQTPVKFQGGLGSCVGFDTSAHKESYDTREYGKNIDLSEQFLYGKCKETDGMPNIEGTYIRAAMKVLQDFGVCEETYFPYEGKYPPNSRPKEGYLENAAKYKLSTYAAVGVTKEEMRRALYQNGPVSVGIMVYDSFMNTGSDGIVKYPSGAKQGGHAILVIGYNKIGLICKNSWSTQWGNKGYCTIPWLVWEAINMGEAWTIVDVMEEKKPWTDWPDSELESAWVTKNSGILLGYEDGSFHPWDEVTMHQAITIAKRLGFNTPRDKESYWSTPALRGWIHENWSQYLFLEERWNETITRFQFALIIG
ncbi:MAG: C1 family peptidase, partial [Bacilli bacterium]